MNIFLEYIAGIQQLEKKFLNAVSIINIPFIKKGGSIA